MSALGHLSDPTLLVPLLSGGVQGIFELLDNIRMRNDPNIRGLRNFGIGQTNQLMQEAGSGAGVSNPYRNLSEYSRTQIGNSSNIHTPFAGSLSTIGSGKPGAFKLPEMGAEAFGNTSMFDQPYRTTTERTQQGSQPMQPLKPVGPGFLERVGEGVRNFLGSFEVGTTSIPQDGLAIVHQGEAIVPKEMNPAAQPPGVAGAPMRPVSYAQTPPPPPAPSGPPPAPATAPVTSTQTATSPGPLTPNYNVPQAGLNPQVQQMILQRGREQTGAALQSQERQLRERAAQQGQAYGGNLENQMFQALLAANQQNSNLLRDLSIEAENRRFADQSANNQFLLNQQLGLGQLQLGNRELGVQEALGNRNADIAQQSANTQRDLGFGGLDLQRQELAQQGDIARAQLSLGQQELGLNRELGLGQLSLGRDQLGLNRELGLGQLGLGRDQLSLDRQLGLGNLDIARQNQALQAELGRGQLANDTRGVGIQQQLADLQAELGRGDQSLRQQQQQFEQGRAFDERRRQFDAEQALARELGLGNLGVQNRGLDLAELQQRTDTEFGQFDRNYRSFWDALNRQDGLAGLNAQANQSQEEWLQDFIDRLFGQAGLPQATGA